jgi:hypothetical protein
MRRMLLAILFLILAICFSCEEKGWFVKCQDCLEDEPELGNLYIKLSPLASAVRLSIFEGDLEDSVLYHSDNITWPDYSYQVPLNKKYTVTATYNIEGKKYIAVDSATPRVKYTEDQCKDPCYYVYDNNLNLSIKYTAGGN